ncbi:MAG: c-type cytochrome, partial [Verrucomicrobiales bacterium]|nr:c-type cytochrome [Verrucomicrobiales bacterium]
TEDLSQYLSFSRYLFDKDTELNLHRRYLKGLRRMESFAGGRWFERTVTKLQKEAQQRLTEEQKIELAEWLEPVQKPVPQPADGDPPQFVSQWRMADFDEAIEHPLEDRDLANGKSAYIKAQCATCHRCDGVDAQPASHLGPDLSGIGSRFGVADMLESMIHPSRVIGDKYRNPAGPNISLMPPGLINVLDRESVLDLLAFLQKGKGPL